MAVMDIDCREVHSYDTDQYSYCTEYISTHTAPIGPAVVYVELHTLWKKCSDQARTNRVKTEELILL